MKLTRKKKGSDWKFLFDFISNFRDFIKTAGLAESPITAYKGTLFLRPLGGEVDREERIIHRFLVYEGPEKLPEGVTQIGINPKTGEINDINGTYDTDLTYLPVFRYDYSDYYREVTRQLRERFGENTTGIDWDGSLIRSIMEEK